jgi:cytochrome c nitrite reductase small subunit
LADYALLDSGLASHGRTGIRKLLRLDGPVIPQPTAIERYIAGAMTRSLLAAAIGAGALVGLGGFTFDYGEGLSYFSTDPRACKNCHVMNDQYASWVHAPHHAVATCVECHLPHEFARKYLAKADNGYRHSRGFTFMDFHDPIMITPGNAASLQENCLRCHGDFVHDIVRGSTTSADAVRCVHCHRGVGHGARP